MTWRALIVDDEPPSRRWLRELLAAHPEITVEAEAGDISSAMEAARRIRPDVVFLDVQMPPGTGFDLLPELTAGTRVVFVTAHDSYAIRAFDANAFDYLLKPVHPKRLAESVRRLFASPTSVLPPSDEAVGPQDLVPLRDRGTLRMVAVDDIVAIQAEAAYSRVLLSGCPPMMVLRSISDWERLLPAPPFARIDRSLLVNLPRVRVLDTQSRDESRLELRDLPEPLRLGRTASLRLRRLLAPES